MIHKLSSFIYPFLFGSSTLPAKFSIRFLHLFEHMAYEFLLIALIGHSCQLINTEYVSERG